LTVNECVMRTAFGCHLLVHWHRMFGWVVGIRIQPRKHSNWANYLCSFLCLFCSVWFSLNAVVGHFGLFWGVAGVLPGAILMFVK